MWNRRGVWVSVALGIACIVPWAIVTAHRRRAIVDAIPRRLDRIAILGERNSGTNAVEAILKANIATRDITIQVVVVRVWTIDGPTLMPRSHAQAGLSEIKHYMQRWPADGRAATAKTLVLMVVRNPYDWLRSMHRMCYCCEDLCVDNKPFEAFLDSTFELSPVDPVTFEKRPTLACPVDENIYVDDPDRRAFVDVLDARYRKAFHFLNMSRWAAGFDVVHWEDVLDPEGQERVIGALLDAWSVPQVPGPFRPVMEDARFWKNPREFVGSDRARLSSESSVRSSSSASSSHARCATFAVYLNPTGVLVDERAREACRSINARIDPFVEQILGYHVLECDVSDT